MKTIKKYIVSGEIHGSIVFAKTRQQAEFIFKRHYLGESIWSIKRSNSIQF